MIILGVICIFIFGLIMDSIIDISHDIDNYKRKRRL
jgi:hypothetical protein